MIFKFHFAACTLCACIFAAASARAENVFEIGLPDASAAEFKDFGVDFNAARFYFDETKTDPSRLQKNFSPPE